MSPVRALGVPIVAVPAVAAVHAALTGSLPTVPALLAVLAVAVVAGLLAGSHGSRRLLGALLGAQLAAHAVLWLVLGQPASSCLPVLGRGARVGLDLALLRHDTACASGVSAGVGAYAALFCLLLAATLVLGQVLVATAGGLALRGVEAAWTALRTLLAHVVPVLLTPVHVTPVLRPRPAPRLVPMTSPVVVAPLVRRGPPAPGEHVAR